MRIVLWIRPRHVLYPPNRVYLGLLHGNGGGIQKTTNITRGRRRVGVVDLVVIPIIAAVIIIVAIVSILIVQGSVFVARCFLTIPT